MTLGGLALAVGILVDDATVTIENINWHLRARARTSTTAILDGAQQIVVPAFVSLLCICIVFVPMFALKGVAGFLFVPMAEAVVFAMIASFILSRTLVPTMAMYLLQAARARGRMTRAASPQPAGPLPAAASRPASSSSANGYSRHPGPGAGAPAACSSSASWSWSSPPSPCCRSSGANFFPSVDAGQITMHVRPPVGTRIEDASAEFGDIEQTIRQTIPADEVELDRRQHRPADQLDQHHLQQLRPDRVSGRRHLRQPEREAPSDRRLCPQTARASCRRPSPARPSRSCPPTSSARS